MEGTVNFMTTAVTGLFDLGVQALNVMTTNENLAIYFFAGLAFLAVGLVNKLK